MRYTPEQGDIVWLDFDPSSGKEIIKRRPAFVISQKKFNEAGQIRGCVTRWVRHARSCFSLSAEISRLYSTKN
jgi:mRNA-degrading endonuclease toxin of MazEF toxin-antitoxin module